MHFENKFLQVKFWQKACNAIASGPLPTAQWLAWEFLPESIIYGNRKASVSYLALTYNPSSGSWII